MEVDQSNSYEMKKPIPRHADGLPFFLTAYLAKRSTKGFLPDSAGQYQLSSCLNKPAKFKRRGKGGSMIGKINKLGEGVDNFAQRIREHVKVGKKISETVKGKLRLGAKILQVGGMEKVFKYLFSAGEEEKLLKASQCYLSTTAGPIAGLLFLSTDRVAFCSDKSIKLTSSTGEFHKIRYKVSIPLRKIKRVDECENAKKPSRKYIQVLTEDNFEFWFMGFLNHRKAFTYLHQIIAPSL